MGVSGEGARFVCVDILAHEALVPLESQTSPWLLVPAMFLPVFPVHVLIVFAGILHDLILLLRNEKLLDLLDQNLPPIKPHTVQTICIKGND